jgi:hypothetical protein
MIEDECHIERHPYCEPLKPASHDHQNDEGQRVPGIDRRGDQKGTTVKPAAGHQNRLPRGAYDCHDAARGRQHHGDGQAPMLRQPTKQREPATSVVALLPPVAGHEAEHQDTDCQDVR